MNRRQFEKGMTLLEVVLAISILSLVLLALNATLVSSLRETSLSGARTQAVQIVNYVGRRIVGGDTSLLPGSDPLNYTYGELHRRFPDLPQEVRYANPNLYRLSIRNLGTPSWANALGVGVREYQILVCWRQGGREFCTEGRTFSAPPSSTSPSAPLLEGIN